MSTDCDSNVCLSNEYTEIDYKDCICNRSEDIEMDRQDDSPANLNNMVHDRSISNVEYKIKSKFMKDLDFGFLLGFALGIIIGATGFYLLLF